MAVTFKDRRNALLAETDWTQLPDTPLTILEKTAWAAYRQALRDMTETEKARPDNPVWPIKPIDGIREK